MKNRFDYKYNGTGARAPPEIDLLSSPTDAVSRAHGKIRSAKIKEAQRSVIVWFDNY